MKILAVDYGDSRTGIAVCDKNEVLASPCGQIESKSMDRTCEAVCEAAAREGAEMIVVGLPLNMNGTEGPRAEKTRKFIGMLEFRCGLPVVPWDERGTTITATYYMNQTNTRGKKRKAVLDSASAVVILENYLEYRKNKGLS
ncbi:MAG: Holliday junction resolvase RuvX [Oscillospiraceae bacterium]